MFPQIHEHIVDVKTLMNTVCNYYQSIIYKKEGLFVKMGKMQAGWKRVLLYGAVILLLFIFQEVLLVAGKDVANMFSYESIDPHKAYAWNYVHHITIMLLALIAILILKKVLKVDFGFGFGDWKIGTRYVVIFTGIFAGIALVVHVLMKINNSLPVYAFPLNKNNIIGTLCFQLLLTGPAEEMLYRALPITIFVHVLGKKIEVKWGITLEIIIGSFLFAIAHIKWSVFPLTIEADYSQLFYAFLQGIISGKAYQDSGSVIYPMFMHSISNVLMVGTGYIFRLL